MQNDSAKLIRIGIECEQLEEGSWGVARLVSQLLKELASRPHLRDQFRFRLYFKSHIPDWEFLNDPLFEKEVIWQPLPRHSFVLYYYVFLPIRLWFARLDAMYYPNYMLPIIHPPWIPSLVMLTEDIWHEMRSPRQLFQHRLAYRVFGYWSAWWATRIMAISKSSAEHVRRLFHIAPTRIAVNELAIDPPRDIHGLTRTQPYLLYVGQAFERRHLRETLAAFKELSPSFPGLQFVFVGPDKYQPPLVLPPDVIHFEQVTDQELAALYANAKAIVYVSWAEAFGLPPLEALAYGTPAVVADTPVSRELFGDNAFFVKDAGDIPRALRAALTDTERHQRIREAAPTILARFTWSRHADRWLNIINEILHA